ncbi:MAG: hypothetical protein KIT83_21175, partial [Bryobacterales bacterium]|nr:hypothetical protein [Bryobacterales bacterium]
PVLIPALLLLSVLFLGAQESLGLNDKLWTESRLIAFENRQKTEATITVPYGEVLYGELFSITVRLHNPTLSDLELPLAFDVRSGTISIEKKDSRQAKTFGLEYFRMAPDPQAVNPTCPTFFLKAGETLTQAFWSIPSMNRFSLNLGLHPGEYRLVYQYGPSNYAYFKVLGSLPMEMFKVVELPDVGPRDQTVRRTALFTIQLGEDRWLFQVLPTIRGGLEKKYLDLWPKLTTDQMETFTRVARLPGPLTRLEARLIGDSTLHIEFEITGGTSRTIETKVNTGELIREW